MMLVQRDALIASALRPAVHGSKRRQALRPRFQESHRVTARALEETPRDPEDRPVNEESERALREKHHDKTLADSFPTSDPPSTIPDPIAEP